MIEAYLKPLIHYLEAHPHVGQLLAFAIAFAESLPLIGTIVPGSITMTAMGTLIGTGVLPGVSTMICASIGALAGDCTGFWAGRHYQYSIHRIWPFKNHPEWLQRSEKFFTKHGGKSIIFGRFVGPARSTVPLVAGLLDMSWWRFISAAVPSAIMWALLYMVPGILLGAIALELPRGETAKFIIIGLLIIFFTWFVFWAIQYFFKELARLVNRIVDKSWDWLQRHHASKGIIRLITNQQDPQDHHQLTLLSMACLCGLLFLILFWNVLHQGLLTHINQPVFNFLQSLHTPHWNTFFITLTLLAKTKYMAVTGLIIVAGLAACKRWRACLHLLTAIVLASGAILLFKILSHSARPTGFVLVKSSSSFPSGHTTLSTTILGMLAFYSVQKLKQQWHWIPYVAVCLLALLIGMSRLYLGAHWFSDIIGSYLLSLCILLLVILSYRRNLCQQSWTINPWIWLGIMIIGLGLPWGYQLTTKFQQAEYNYQPFHPTFSVAKRQWWRHPLKYLPIYRNNRFGHPIQPFNVQWAGQLSVIKKRLIQHGWQTSPYKPALQKTLQRFASKKPEYHMPIFPWQYLNKPAALTLIKHIKGQKKIIELRLWHSNIQFKNNPSPLWLGSVNFHVPLSKLLNLKGHHGISLKHGGGMYQLYRNIGNRFERKLIHIPSEKIPTKIKPLHWDQRLLLIQD